MPAWAEYKQAAVERGSLALELYAIISTPISSPDALKQNLPDHLAYQAELEQQGKLVMAGPLSDETGALMEGVGMIVYRAHSLEAAKTMAEADPMHKSGTRSFTIRRWLVNEGSFQLDLKLSTQQIRL